MTVDYRPLLKQITDEKRAAGRLTARVVDIADDVDDRSMLARQIEAKWGRPLTKKELAETDKQVWLDRLTFDDPAPPVVVELEGHPYRGGGTAQTAAEPPKGFWRGAWERLTALWR
jgi:hypothetical protein